MGDTESIGRRGWTDNENGRGGGNAHLPIQAREMNETLWATPAARDWRYPNAKPFNERGGGYEGRATGEPGGAWSDAEWISGADGKARRVKSGVCLLVNGLPGRVGRLRGYGNAIVPQVAEAFIRAFLEGIDN